MSSVNRMEFDLLRHMQLSLLKDDKQLTVEEKESLAEQRHRELDEAQYIAHRAQDRVSRIREQFGARGRTPKPNSYTRDADHKYGLFWFGKGKYKEEDKPDASDVQDQEGQSNDISEADGVSDEARFNVWRPIVGSRRLKGWSGNETIGSVHGDQIPNLRSETPFLSVTVPALKKRKPALTPPWAEHYKVGNSADGNYVNSAEHHYALFARGILPRGVNGMDDILRSARRSQDLALSMQRLRLQEDRRQEQQRLKTALDEQLLDKRRRRLAQYEEELIQIYGPTMQHILSDTFQQPLLGVASADVEEKRVQREAAPQLHFGQRIEASAARAQRSRQAWLAAWEDRKRNVASAATVASADAFSSVWGHQHTLRGPSSPLIGQHHRYLGPQYRDELSGKRGETIIGLNKSNSTFL